MAINSAEKKKDRPQRPPKTRKKKKSRPQPPAVGFGLRRAGPELNLMIVTKFKTADLYFYKGL